jgi:serine/threonine protein kinase
VIDQLQSIDATWALEFLTTTTPLARGVEFAIGSAAGGTGPVGAQHWPAASSASSIALVRRCWVQHEPPVGLPRARCCCEHAAELRHRAGLLLKLEPTRSAAAMDRYIKGSVCGRGADGTVKMATLTELGQRHHRERFAATGKRYRDDLTVAIKKIRAVDFRNPQAGLKVEALREVKILNHLAHAGADEGSTSNRPHAHIVSLLDVFVHKRHSLKLVFDYLPIHLQHVLDSRRCELTPAMIKAFGAQLLRGIAHLHTQQVRESFQLHGRLEPRTPALWKRFQTAFELPGDCLGTN